MKNFFGTLGIIALCVAVFFLVTQCVSCQEETYHRKYPGTTHGDFWFDKMRNRN